MGCSFEIMFLLLFTATSVLTNDQGRSESDPRNNSEYHYDDFDGASDCLKEKQYVERSSNNTLNITGIIKSHFTGLDTKLIKLVTEEYLDNSTSQLVFRISILLMDELRNQTQTEFSFLDRELSTLASKSAIEDLRSILDNMPNKDDTNRLEKQLSSLKTEHSDIKLVCENTDSSSSPSTEEKTQSLSEVMKRLDVLQELMKKNKCDTKNITSGQQYNQPSKQSFEKSDIFGIISVVGLVVLFVLVIFLIKRQSAIHNKLSNMQIQVAHERYYRRESDATPKSLQHTKPQEQRNGSVVATNPVINMYEDSEITESLMDKN